MASKPIGIRFAIVLLLALITACSTAAQEATPEPSIESPGITLTIGDISDEPKKKIDRFQPLADFMAANLTEFGFGSGRVVIASSVEEMIEFVEDGQVDVYFDSAFPALTTQASTDTALILRRWKDGDPVYKGVIFTAEGSVIDRLEELKGRVIAAEEPYSTTGFAIQSIDLARAGFELQVVPSPDTPISSNVIGLWFSRDEENSLEAVLNGTVPAGFMSDQDLADFRPEVRSQIRMLSESGPLPRQVVSIRGDLDDRVVERISTLLLGLSDSEEGRQMLEQIKTVRFDVIPSEDRQRLDELSNYLQLLP